MTTIRAMMDIMKAAIGVCVVAVTLLTAIAAAARWQSEFPVDKKNLGVTGSNPYFVLIPGYQLSYAHGNDTDTVTVLDETKVIDGVTTRVVEDRETKNGKVVEITRDYYAIDATTGDVYYFGEDVDVYRNGKVAGHRGSWLSGVNGARFGLMMPGSPKVAQRFYQEHAPAAGMDRAEIQSTMETITTPAGTFHNCVHVIETNPLEPGARDHKSYAPGIGAVKDGEMLLLKYGRK